MTTTTNPNPITTTTTTKSELKLPPNHQAAPRSLAASPTPSNDRERLAAKLSLNRLTRKREPNHPSDGLIFTEEAFKKLKWFRDKGNTEVGAMCETTPLDPLFVTDVHFIKQECSSVTTEFDEDAQHNFVVDMTEKGLNSINYMRIWVHTHPSKSASPSSTDIETFTSSFGSMPWAVMAILGKDASDEMYCVFRHRETSIHIPVYIDKKEAEIPKQWEKDFKDNITTQKRPAATRWSGSYGNYGNSGYLGYDEDDWAGHGNWTGHTDGQKTMAEADSQGLFDKEAGITAVSIAPATDDKLINDFFGVRMRAGTLYPPTILWWQKYTFSSIRQSFQDTYSKFSNQKLRDQFKQVMVDSMFKEFGISKGGQTSQCFFEDSLESEVTSLPLMFSESPSAALIALRNLHPGPIQSYAGLEDIFAPYFDHYMPNEMFAVGTPEGKNSEIHCISTSEYDRWCETCVQAMALEELLVDLSVRQDVGWKTDSADDAITDIYEYIIDASESYVTLEELEEEIEVTP